MASNEDIEITFDVGQLTRGITQYETRFKSALRLLCDVSARKMEEWAKQNAPWTDRTGNARQGLKGQAYWGDRETMVIVVSHSVDYGLWLELAMNRNYAVLEDAIEEKRSELFRAIERLMK